MNYITVPYMTVPCCPIMVPPMTAPVPSTSTAYPTLVHPSPHTSHGRWVSPTGHKKTQRQQQPLQPPPYVGGSAAGVLLLCGPPPLNPANPTLGAALQRPNEASMALRGASPPVAEAGKSCARRCCAGLLGGSACMLAPAVSRPASAMSDLKGVGCRRASEGCRV